MFAAKIKPGDVLVSATVNRGFTPEEIAERMVGGIISISDTAPEPIRLQAHAFREKLLPLCEFYLREACQSDRTTLFNRLRDAGFPDAADMIRRL